MDTRTKILSGDQARTLAGRRLILAAGAFDVLQAAHARFLGEVRCGGAELLVVVYEDAGLDRPILPEQARAQLVAALAVVDHVLIWPRARLDSLVEILRPERVEHAGRGERNIIEEVLARHK